MKKILIALFAIAVITSLAGVTSTPIEAAGPTCTGLDVPGMGITKADTHKFEIRGRVFFGYVRAEWYGVSAANTYRMEVTPQGGGHTRSNEDTPSYSGGRNMDTVRIDGSAANIAHDVRVLALDRGKNIIACGYKVGQLWSG